MPIIVTETEFQIFRGELHKQFKNLANNFITILDEAAAIAAALDSATQSSLVVIFPDKVDSAIAIIESRKSKMSS